MKKLIKKTIKNLYKIGFRLFVKIIYRYNLYFKLNRLNRSNTLNKNVKQEIIKYWNQFNISINTDWHKWYISINGIESKKYIPEDIFYGYIEPFYNRLDLAKAYSDKALYSHWLPEVKQPNTIARNIGGIYYDNEFNVISLKNVINKCQSYQKLIIKPTLESGGGKGILFIESKNNKEMNDRIFEITKLFGKNFIIQEIIQQHHIMSSLNPSSVNTIRIITFFSNNKVHVLSAHVRIGDLDENQDHYGYVCGIKDDGTLEKFARKTKVGSIITKHPLGYVFQNIQIPSYQEIKSIAQNAHLKFGHFRLISWDFAIDINSRPILIEYNLRWQGLNNHQLTVGPLFGGLTDSVLEEVFGRK